MSCTVVFDCDARGFEHNPFDFSTPFGKPETIALGDQLEVRDDLLDACKVALGHMTGGLDGDYRDCDPRDILRAAIAKAELSTHEGRTDG